MCFKENEIYYQKQANLNQFDSFFKLQKAQWLAILISIFSFFHRSFSFFPLFFILFYANNMTVNELTFGVLGNVVEILQWKEKICTKKFQFFSFVCI
jgi:hypothetical protein